VRYGEGFPQGLMKFVESFTFIAMCTERSATRDTTTLPAA
jgi:hypothetical protein